MEHILHDIFVNKRNKMDIFEELGVQINDKIEEFRNKIEMVRKGFAKLIELAKKI